jgi:NAD(P)-dependent dehydrogenase (short-subunit alcohol dehydrogenase family)
MEKQIATSGLYTTARILAPHLESLASTPGSKPTLLVTSGGLYKQPYHPFFSLAQSKAAQHNLTMSISQVLKPKGVHVAAIIVHGLVREDSPIFAPKKIAETYWKVYEERTEKEVWITDGKGWQPAL